MIIPIPIIMHSGSGGAKFSELPIFGKAAIIIVLIVLLVTLIVISVSLIIDLWEIDGPKIKKWFRKRKERRKNDKSGNGR